MDAGEYETNTLAITNIASISFRVYKQVASPTASLYPFSPSDVERTLRNDGHIVFCDSRRQGFWSFRLLRKDGSAIGSSPRTGMHNAIEIGPHKLAVVDEGAFEPSTLVKGRPAAPNPINTPSSSSSSGLSAPDAASRGAGAQPIPGGNTAPPQSSAAGGGGTTDTPHSNSAPPESRPFLAVPTKLVYNFFLSAVIASISSSYCLRANAIALNNRTFLLPPLDPLWDGEESSRTDTKCLVATLRVSLTTAGALLVNLSHTILQGMGCSEWACYAGIPPPGSTVLTAPWGNFATVRGTYPSLAPAGATGHVLGQTKRELSPSSIPQAWKVFAAKMLEMRGTSSSVLHDSSWLRVEFVLGDDVHGTKSVVILWPSVLCFWSLESSVVSAPSFQRLDPLNDLRAAFLEEARAEEAAFRPREDTREDKEDDVAMEDMHTVSSMDKGPLSDGPSPIGARQPVSLAGMIYPTPPDGILNLVGATPTFDGSVASPGNAASTTMPADLDPAAEDHEGGDDEFGSFWASSDPKREEAEQGFIEEPDTLFGDIVGDVVGDDVTDADFNFFDDKQPDGMHLPAYTPTGHIDDGMDLDTTSRRGDTSAYAHSDMETHLDAGATPGESIFTPAAAPEPSSAENADVKGESDISCQRPSSPVFAKPELRHARSNLGDASANGIKRPPSPFNAVTVFKRVRAMVEANKAQQNDGKHSLLDRRGKLFEGLQFTDFMIQNNKKYEQNGKFGFRWPHPESYMLSNISSATSPTAFRRPIKKQPELSDSSPEFASLISSITRGLKTSSLHAQSPLQMEDSGDASSSSSSYESSSEDSDGDEPLANSTAQRKIKTRPVAETAPSLEAATELSKAYREGVWDFPIARYFAEPMPSPTELNYTDDDIVDVAQIVTQQVTRATIRTSFDEDSGTNLQKTKLRRTLLQRIRYSMATLQDSLPACLDDAHRCSLKPYLEVPDIPLLMQPNRPHQRLSAASEPTRTNLWACSTPSVAIRRNESTLSILPTAVEFWEVLGLEPLHGTKDIAAVCMYPHYEGLAEEVASFLSRMRIVYESLRLGSHEPLPSKSNVVDGMLAFEVPSSYATPSGSAAARSEFPGSDQLHKLAQALAAEDTPGKSLVLYFVYCEEVTTSIVDACLAFQRLSHLYESAVTSRNSEPNDLVLQLIPASFIALETSLTVPSPTEMLRLSLEVYDRCASPRGPKPSPSFLLEQPPPRLLDLKLSSTPPVDVQRENSFIHVAYAFSADGRWVTAAWTDNSGWRQFSSAYWMGRKDAETSSNVFAAVAQEIWTNTCAIVSNLKVHWRVVIAKCSPMEQEEIDAWLELCKAETRVSISAVLVTVDTDPALELMPPIITASPAILSQLSAATPAPTPQASVFSPDQTGNPVTPAGTTPVGAPTPATPSGGSNGAAGTAAAPNSPAVASNPAANASNEAGAKLAAAGADPNTVADIEGNVVLVDITDNTWLAIASHRLNTSTTWVDMRHALVSGYVIKRGGIGRDEAPVVMEVNVIRAEGNPRVYDNVAREILTAYRSLGTLARARGILDNERDVRPWHVAAAERSAQGLCRWM
ncbi:hypothetical protein F503_08296 [Ophiostoma piceae UAMH 11346]|uniref:Mediator of RNA polymerase II transcription subunit 13 n=1 Tax=Ophiostoma piceae (strain UAMH 11346) TaxID=1262450 RepID=S3CY20_OPHP1|nr:hypothetical protein F503_08296 [Ophiostoma piceae UAMH 11346]